MAKKTKEAEYIRSKTNALMLNYRVYYMTAKERLTTILIGFAIGALVGYVFYGNQFLDADGAPTSATGICNLVILLVAGAIGASVFVPMRTEQLRAKRQTELTKQFRSWLDSLAVALSTGMNTHDALASSKEDLIVEYGPKSHIVNEVTDMISSIHNNIPLVQTLNFFSERSQIEDIANFSTVFAVSSEAGGNIKDVVRRTSTIISDKLAVNEQIETTITSNKSQFTVMMFIPVVIIMMMRSISSDFARSFSSITGVLVNTVALGIFYIAFRIGNKIMDIKR